MFLSEEWDKCSLKHDQLIDPYVKKNIVIYSVFYLHDGFLQRGQEWFKNHSIFFFLHFPAGVSPSIFLAV